jgi:hypothetical protein
MQYQIHMNCVLCVPCFHSFCLRVVSGAAEAQTDFGGLEEVQMHPVIVLRIVEVECAHSLLCKAAHFVDGRIVEPHAPRGNAERRGGAVEDDRLEPVNGHARIGPPQGTHQMLREVPVLAAKAVVPTRIREVSC